MGVNDELKSKYSTCHFVNVYVAKKVVFRLSNLLVFLVKIVQTLKATIK